MSTQAGEHPGSPHHIRTGDRRTAFSTSELAIVLSHYDIGVIEWIRDFPRGSSRSPKALIKSERGPFLLKRRAPGKEEPQRVAFCHALQLHLASRGFPAPRLVGERRTNNSIVRHKDRTYELFEFIQGSHFDHTPESATAAGRELATLHRMLADHTPSWRPGSGSFHDDPRIDARIASIPEVSFSQSTHHPQTPTDPEESPLPPLTEIAQSLRDAYHLAADEVNALGIANWPKQIIHGDWHPGNMLFRSQQIAAVLDYDAARQEPRVIDIANGALQFSVTRQGDSPDNWPDSLDEDRFRAFCHGYDLVQGCTISSAEIQAIPWLMIEAIVVEAVIPIAATGFFADIEGGAFLRMVERKASWIHHHASKLQAIIDA